MKGAWESCAAISLYLAAAFAPPEKDTVATHLGKGYEYIQVQRYEDAANEFRKALAFDSTLVRARYQLAVCLFALAERDEAERTFEELRRTTADAPDVLYYLGRLRLLATDYDGAVNYLEQTVSAPPFPDAAFYLGCAYLGKGDVDKAIKALENAKTAAPRDARVPYRLARAYSKAGRAEDAKAEYERSLALRRDVDSAAQQSNECAKALSGPDRAAAAAICEKVSDPNDPDRLTMLGILYGEHGMYEQAISPLERAAQLDPDSFEIFHNLGLSYFRLRRYGEARKPLERAVALRPDYYASNALLGAVLFTSGEDAAAYSVLTHANELRPDNTETANLLVKVAVLLARQRYKAGDFDGSIAYLRKAISVSPNEPALHTQLSQLYRQTGRQRLADEESQVAARLAERR